MSHHVPTTDEAVAARREQVEGHTESHGHSWAAWMGVLVCLVGALAGCIGVVLGWDFLWLTIVGLALMAVSGLVTIALSKAGFGAQGRDAGHGGPEHTSRRIR